MKSARLCDLCGLIVAMIVGSCHSAVVTVNLTVDAFRFANNNTPIVFTTRAYNGAFGGPVIRVKQGDTLVIHLENRLGEGSGGPLNWFRYPNTTNLHLHGLHISPMGTSDDIFRLISPNSTGTYMYQIPDDHSPGTFWYHPHVHGSSSLQQSGGMAGALIVEPLNTTMLPPALSAMAEEVMLLQHLCFHDLGQYQSSTPYINHLQLVKWGLDGLDPAPQYRYPNDTPDYHLVNGVHHPNITMQPGEFRLFRLVGAGTNAFLELSITGAGGQAGADDAPLCDMYVVAKDGIYVDASYQDPSPLLVPGCRLDLAVRCSQSGHYTLQSRATAPYHSQLAPATVVWEGELVSLVIAGDSVDMQPPSELPPRPKYLPDLRNVSGVPESQQFTVDFHTVGGPFKPGPPYPAMYINGKSFSDKDAYIHNMSLGAVQQWKVGIQGDSSAGAGNHPYHQHVNPYQVVLLSGLDSVFGMKLGEYRDTMPLWQGGAFTIRFIPDRFPGRALVHCHMVPHADLGMAAVVKILNHTVRIT